MNGSDRTGGAPTVLDVATVIAAVNGSSVGTPATGSGTGAAHVGRTASLTCLTSLRSVLAGRGAPGAVLVLASAAELTTLHASLARGEVAAPALVVIGGDVVPPTEPPHLPLVAVADTRLALAVLSALFDTRPLPASGVHPTAVVDATAHVAAGVALGPGAVVAAGASIGAGSVIGANVTVGAGARVGAACVLYPGVCLYDGVSVGDRAILHAGVVIGADGFGYAAGPGGAVKLRHSGAVIVHDDVEIGANTTVDRGTIDDTVIGPRTKLDNLCQVGHNVVIGSDCLIAGTTAIAGSAVIGNGVILGGNVAVSDHVTVHDGARVAGRSGVTKDVPAGETWAGFPARPYRQFARGLYLLDKLESMWQFVKRASREGNEA